MAWLKVSVLSKSPNPKRLSGVTGIFQTLLEDAMKYLCLVYQEEKQEQNVPRKQIEQAKQDYWAFTEDIKKSGHYVGSNGLKHTDAATTVRVRNGKLSTTDGPFAETKEQLGGYFLIEAKDLNDAIQVAARIPSAKWGSIE
ncbi:MAG TPA: YciI family protein, partial [Gemmatimonadales bacterium]|nr:YciI family protein [Gemmatimonadales bacterium]